MKVKSESEVAQSCLTLRNPMDCSLPDSCTHGIFQARVLEWGAIAFSEMFPWYLLILEESSSLSHSIVFLYVFALIMEKGFLILSSADGHLGCFHVLPIVNSAVKNIGVHVSLSILVSSVCMPSSGIAGS